MNGNPILSECYKIIPDKETKIEKAHKGKIEDWLNTDYNHKSTIKYSEAFGKDIITELVNTSVFDTTLVFDYNGKNINCIRYKDNFEITNKHKFFASVNSSFEIVGESIYGSKLGIIYYTTTNKRNGETSQWQLDRIIDYQDYIIEKTGANTLP
ncbi:hypothetical protein [Carboxylicivirga sp. RSCT41]|uniref:hypothetical protein n=1 Tax=Carboxylicivirga agarovorans TaxID=3417570 RepID=UPI003D340CB8